MRIKQDGRDDATVQMAPLIDCLFLLLIFFLVAATLKQAHNEVDIRIADTAVAAAPKHDQTPFVIEVREDGQYYLKGAHVGLSYMSLEPVPAQIIQEQLRDLAVNNPRQVIRIDGDRRTAFQHVVRMLDMCKYEGLKNIKVKLGN
jgi:biopolymer transport protein ExbD